MNVQAETSRLTIQRSAVRRPRLGTAADFVEFLSPNLKQRSAGLLRRFVLPEYVAIFLINISISAPNDNVQPLPAAVIFQCQACSRHFRIQLFEKRIQTVVPVDFTEGQSENLEVVELELQRRLEVTLPVQAHVHLHHVE